MNKSESIKELATALAKAQGEIENATKATNNAFFKSKYADLAECLNTVRPVFSKHGLSLSQFPSFENGIASVESILMHGSGEWISNVASAPVSKQDAQGVGSATTYLLRYSLAAIAGIAQEDDDANSAIGHKQIEYVNNEQELHLDFLLKESQSDVKAFLKHFKSESLKKLLLSDYPRAVEALNKKIEQLTKAE